MEGEFQQELSLNTPVAGPGTRFCSRFSWFLVPFFPLPPAHTMSRICGGHQGMTGAGCGSREDSFSDSISLPWKQPCPSRPELPQGVLWGLVGIVTHCDPVQRAPAQEESREAQRRQVLAPGDPEHQGCKQDHPQGGLTPCPLSTNKSQISVLRGKVTRRKYLHLVLMCKFNSSKTPGIP